MRDIGLKSEIGLYLLMFTTLFGFHLMRLSLYACAGQPNQTPSPSLPCEKQEAANSNVKSSEQVSPSLPSKMVTPDVPSKWIEVYEDG